MANYDEVVKRNKDYLTQAQINALAAASKEYNIANAGNRAGALESARQQYDTAYRGLQNMGLAGNPNAAPASGEVPRLQMQIKTPFDSYNERLKQVENQRLGALGEQFKQDTIAQRQAEEAARAAQAEAMRRAQLQAAAQTLQSKALKIGTTVMKGVANKLMGISSTKKENPAAVAAATKAQVDGLKRTQQVQQQTVNAAVKAQIDGMNRTARPQDVAAAAMFNISHYSQQPAVTAANAAQDRGAKLTEQLKGSAETSTANRYYVDANQKAFTKEQAEVEYKEAQNNLTNLQQKRHGGGAVSEDEYKAAVYQRDAAKLKAENPKLYQSFAIIENPYADAKSREEAGNEIMRAYGYTNDERTAEQYTADKKKAAQYSSYLAIFDDKNASAEEKKAAENMLKNMGVTPDQAREFISKHRQARAGQGEYAYYKNAILNSLTYAGKTPSRGVNKDETDPLYRAVNKLNAEKGDDYNLMYSELAALPDDVTTGEEYVGNELRYLTEDERNAYNYIYETEGLAAANQYIRDGLPLRNIRAATEDEAYAKQLVKDQNGGFAGTLLGALKNAPADALSIAAGTFGNVPAMLNKLVKGTYNFVANPQTPLFIDTNDDMHRLANISNAIQSERSRKILEANPGTSGQVYNFLYQTKMSMAQSAVAMTFAYAGAEGVVNALFFSSAGNEAYNDAIERGATQEQALAYGVLSGTAETLFEKISIENFMNLDYQGKGRVIKNMLSQAGAEASEEINTELANILSDAWVMRDKSSYNLAVKKYMGEGMEKYAAENKAFMDQLGNVAMAGLGGLASGLGFGVFGALPNAVSQVKTGKEAKASKVVDQYMRNAALLGGDAQRLAQEVNDAYGVKKTKSGSIETEKVAGREKMKTTEPSNRLVGALVQQVNKQVQELAQSAESGAAVQTLLTGEKLTTNGAKAVMDQLGADTVKEMGYDTSSPSAFAKSFNARLQENSITPRMQETGKYRQAAYGMAERRNSPIEYKDEFHAFTAEDRANAAVTAARANASNRVWANPTQGMAMTTPDGTKVTPMPGNMRAVEQAEQERTNFKARSTATKGNVTYAVAGMEAREGMSNEQTYSEIQKGLTKEARQKAQLYEKLASALGVKMIIHDVMTGTNGFIDEKGNMHVVLSGKQSVLRVAAHELTHLMKENAGNEYASMRDHLISEVGQEKFDRMTKQKANEYGIDLSTEKGKILADDEVCAELCERMLSNEDALEKFAEKDTAAAKTLKEHLLKILNAIKSAFKRAENRDFGESWSDLIRQQDTIESWITGLQKAIDNANARSNTVEGQISKTAGVTTVDQAQMDEDMREELFLDEDASAAESRRKKAKANAEKGTKVDGITDDEMSRILDRSVYGDKSNYDSDDFKSVQSMLAQLVPEAIDALNGNADLDEVYAEIKTAVGEMLDKYYLDEGDHSALRELIPEVIAVDSTAKSDLNAQDTSLFQMSSKLKKALGRKVTLVGPTNEKFKSAMKLDELWHSAQDRFGLSDYQDFSVDTQKLLDFVQSQTAVRDFDSLHKSERDNIATYQANEFVSAVDEMLAERVDKVIAEHSVDVIEYDMAGYRADLEQKGLMSKGELDELFTTMKKAVKYVKEHRAILDFGEELNTEEDIVAAKQNRAYLPYKQNADPHYKLALDFSTLCKKRILLQMIQERLQGKLKRSLSALETIAIRREILKLQKNGVDVEVACALCYVEAARMKSHKVIDEFLGVGMTKAGRAANVEAEMRNYFAQKDKDIKKVIDKDLAKWKEDKLGKDWTGFTKSGKKVGAANASKDHLKAFGGQKLVDEYNAFAKGTRSKAKVNDAQEEIIKEAKRLVQETPEAFLSAESLAKMKKSNPDIFYAFVNKVRSATRSKALETDTFYSRGDIDMVDEAIIRAANQESGFRHQSWSDFMPIHLLDTMASVIEMSQRDAKMHAYTKVPAMVELLGNTGMMLNMSLIPKGEFGIDKDGNLIFDSVEGMDWDTMMRLRDAFPDTAGNIAIGISDEQIRKLLESPDIDYVIPYHASGMNQTLRTHMNIEHWVEYTKTQNEVEKDGYAPDGKTWKEKHKKGKMKPPALARWFSEEDAKKAGKNGVEYMQKASEKYIDICNKEGWIPKFPQYLTKDADGNYHLNDEYKNYWKMLTDRKMVNHLTGKVIIQQAVKPKFNEQTVMDILKGEAENPTAIRNAAAADEIAGELAKTWRADRENANLKSYKAELNAFREASAVMAADRVKEDVKRRLVETRNSLDTDYMRLAEKQKNGTLTKEDESNLRKMVDDAANAAGYTPVTRYHQTRELFNTFNTDNPVAGLYDSETPNGIFLKTNDHDIGIGGSIQMPLYLSGKNLLHFANREQANAWYSKNVPGYAELQSEMKKELNKFDKQLNDIEDKMFAVSTTEEEYDALDKEWNQKLEAMKPVENEYRGKLRGLLNDYFLNGNSGYDGIELDYDGHRWVDGKRENVHTLIAFSPSQVKSADPVTYDKNGNIIPLSERFNTQKEDIRYDLDTDAIRQAFTVIDTAGIEDGLEALKDVKHVGSFALKDITRFLDASAGKNKDLRNTLHAIFETPHSEATGRYARGVERMQQKVLDIGKRAGVCDEKGKHFDSKKSAAIQNIGEGFSNTYTDLKLKVKDADHVTVRAYEPGTDNLVDSEKDYTLKELRQAYGTNAADYVWSRVFDETQKVQETGGKPGWVDEKVNTRPYTIDDLQTAYPNDWQKLKAAADEFRQMYDEYIRDQNNMLATIYPIESEYADVEKLEAGIEKKQERLEKHKAAVADQIEALQKKLEAKEKEIAFTKSGKKRASDTNTHRQLVEQAGRIQERIDDLTAEIKEYEANAKDELVKMNDLKAEMQNAKQKGDYSLKRMHRLQYRSDYFHHFTEMASGIQNLKSIFTNNTDIAPAIVGKSENTKAKTKWAGYFQQRMGGDYTADALNGMLRYGQLAEYKLAFDPLTAYLRDVNKQIRNMSSDTNRDGLIRYIDQWADTIAGKSHKLDRVVSDAGMAPRKAMQVLQWINSRVIQNTLLFNMRSALVQISNITNAKGIVKNNIDWVNGLKAWALAAKGDEAMASIMAQSNFLASRYMDGLVLTDSKLKSAKQFAGWMLGALDEVSAKATWWAAYQQYTRNPNAAKNQYRNYDSAVDYADDITRRTHAGRGVGELAPAMTSRVINFVAPFQVEVNNTWQLLKDNVKQKNYLGLLSTGLSVFLFNTAFEAIVGSTPLGFDFIRAVIDIALGFLNDDPDDDPDAKEIAQRFAGELVGGLPFASQLVAAFGEDNAKKVLGENNDATRYGNTQIGVNAVVNAAKGLKDIGTGLIEGRRVNWLDDLDDLMNLTLPMGAKQLTRTAQGLATVAKGYGGKYDKEGNEKVQFVTDQDVLHYIHAGLFGKWALTEASEYFGEKRLLPELFGAYNGKKSSIGTMVDAKEYKAALDTGIDGKDYFTLKYDLKSYTTQAGKRAEMMQQSFTPEQKAQLDALMFAGKDTELKAEGSVVYQKASEGEWKVKADYSSEDMFDLSTHGDKAYTGTVEAMEKTGLPQDQAALAADMWEQAKAADDSKQAFRDLLRDNKNLTVEQKEALDKQYCGNKYAADYSDPDLYELSTTNRTLYDKAKAAKSQGIPVKQYVSLNEKKNAYTGEDKADYLRREVMNTNLTAKQKEALDDILISDKDRYIDYSSKAWFEISMLGKGQYTEAKEGTKVGLKPETYLTVYKKWKTLDAKDENGNTRNGLKKKRAKEYLDSLSLSGPEYSYIWTAVFGYK